MLFAAENYTHIPASCRVANGLGIAVIAATICAVLAVLVRRSHAVAAVADGNVDSAPLGTSHGGTGKRTAPNEVELVGSELDGPRGARVGYAVVSVEA